MPELCRAGNSVGHAPCSNATRPHRGSTLAAIGPKADLQRVRSSLYTHARFPYERVPGCEISANDLGEGLRRSADDFAA